MVAEPVKREAEGYGSVQPIDVPAVTAALQRFAGRRVYLHFEFARGGFVRHATVEMEEAVLRGEGPYRVALRCKEDGWVIMEGLTHAELNEGPHVFLCALDGDQRLAQALQISPEPFAP